MKNIFTTCLLLFSMSIFAQEAGKSGELLKNEAKSTEMQTQRTVNSERITGTQTQRNDNSGRSNDQVLDNSNYRKPNQNNNKKPIGNSNYRWNYNIGNSEVFLRIPENGNFSVEIGDQYMSNSSGKFRFFDLRAGTTQISIYENNYLLYRTRINVKNNSRLVLDFFSDYGLYLLGNYPVQNQSYGINEWDDVWNNPYGNQNGNYNGNSGYNGNYYGNVMNNFDFNNLLKAIKKNASFDKDKIQMIAATTRNYNFSSQQIYALVKTMSFDDGKLQVAKSLYTKCVDQQNFYNVYEALSFSSSKNELSDYISRVSR